MVGDSKEMLIYSGTCDRAGTAEIRMRFQTNVGPFTPFPGVHYPGLEHESGEYILRITCRGPAVPAASFELFDPETFDPVMNIFGLNGTHVIVSTAGTEVDARQMLPITLQVTDLATGAVVLEEMITESAQQNCRGPTGCSRNIRALMAQPGQAFLLEAFDKDGNRIASQEFVAP